MHFARTLLVLAAMVLASMALAAPSALALVEVKTEPNPGVHCGAGVIVVSHVVSGGCPFHVAHTESITIVEHNAAHSSETGLSICLFEAEGRISESGGGRFYNQVLSDFAPGSCPFEPCKEGGTGAKESWAFGVVDQGATERLEVGICFQAKGSGVEGARCILHLPITKVGHVYTFNAEPDAGCEDIGDEREFRGRFATENAGEGTHQTIEIVNL